MQVSCSQKHGSCFIHMENVHRICLNLANSQKGLLMVHVAGAVTLLFLDYFLAPKE